MKFAMLVRAHQVSAKLLDLIDRLKRSNRYDLFLCYDEANGPAGIPDIETISYTLDSFADYGLTQRFDAAPSTQMWYFCDFPFYAARKHAPGYDYYLSMEYDTDLVHDRPVFIEALIDRLESQEGRPLDLSLPFLGPATADWPYKTTLPNTPEVHSCMLAFCVVSGRGIDYLYKHRLLEASRAQPAHGYVHSEAFVGTVLSRHHKFRSQTLEKFMPGCIERTSFHPGMPMLLGHPPQVSPNIELLHPVYSEREYLAKYHYFALENDTLLEFVEWLRDGAGRHASPELKAQYEEIALADHAKRYPTAGRRVRDVVRRLPGVAPAYRLFRNRDNT